MSGQVIVGRLAVVLAVVLAVPRALAHGDSAEDLKRRLEQRDPELTRLKKAGRVGETWEGYVEAVVPVYLDDARLKLVVSEENADRKAVYRIIAEETNAERRDPATPKVTPEAVGRRSAIRKFELATPDEFLKVAGNTWIRKKDEPRYRALLALKQQGKVGETWEGFVMPVTAVDPQVAKLVDQENEVRRKRYEQLAKLLKRTPEQVARETAKGYFKDARPDDYVQTADGRWVRRKDLPR
jgi:uncharacterized protein YdbL (DUF1318 family)